MQIDIIDQNNLIGRTNIYNLKKGIEKVLKHLKLSDKTEVCVSFIDDKAMRELNKKYKGIDRTTDVLSFRQDGDLLGDIVISFETAKRHAGIYKTTVEQEVERLLIHGVLHLLGYDHSKQSERKIMRDKEKELLAGPGSLNLRF